MSLQHALLAALVACLPSSLPAQAKQSAQDLVIHLEQLRNGQAVPVRTSHVFQADDVLRFRLKSSVDGYIYVIDKGTSGEYSVLFPPASAQPGNEVVRDKEFLVPAQEDGWFQVSGPAGFDTVYFLLSPTPLAVSTAPTGSKAAPAPSTAKPDPSLMPRCNDAIFQARGECLDDTAGPSALARDAVLPPQIATAAPNASRDLVLSDDREGTVKVTKKNDGPAVYVFRIAHK